MIVLCHMILADLSLSLCEQSSDSEVRRLSEELSQRDELVQKLQQEKEHLVELSQVRPQ